MTIIGKQNKKRDTAIVHCPSPLHFIAESRFLFIFKLSNQFLCFGQTNKNENVHKHLICMNSIVGIHSMKT